MVIIRPLIQKTLLTGFTKRFFLWIRPFVIFNNIVKSCRFFLTSTICQKFVFSKLFRSYFAGTLRKICCSDWEKLLKFDAEGREFSKCLRSLEQFIRTVHRGAFCQYTFRWIYYYGSNKSTGKETGKSHLCAVQWKRSDHFFLEISQI